MKHRGTSKVLWICGKVRVLPLLGNTLSGWEGFMVLGLTVRVDVIVCILEERTKHTPKLHHNGNSLAALVEPLQTVW